jgi:hypothetical protein
MGSFQSGHRGGVSSGPVVDSASRELRTTQTALHSLVGQLSESGTERTRAAREVRAAGEVPPGRCAGEVPGT